MGNGLLAQWGSRIVRRGTATAALLAIPVAVAAVIGFNGGLGGVAGGFFSALDGPESQAAGALTAPGGLDGALAALVGPPGAAGPGDDPGGRSDPDDPNTGGPDTPDGAAPAPGVDPGTELPDVPDATAPVNDPQGGVDTLVDDVNRTVDGIIRQP